MAKIKNTKMTRNIFLFVYFVSFMLIQHL